MLTSKRYQLIMTKKKKKVSSTKKNKVLQAHLQGTNLTSKITVWLQI